MSRGRFIHVLNKLCQSYLKLYGSELTRLFAIRGFFNCYLTVLFVKIIIVDVIVVISIARSFVWLVCKGNILLIIYIF